ncbi:MAG: AAA family ATPase [Verrucomicrobiota bacterium]
MLTHFSIEGFKSFGSPASRVSLEPLTFLVGANASGKSNLVGALRFLRQCFLHGVEVAVNELDGCREVRNRIQRAKPFIISLSASDLPVKFDNGVSYHVKSARYALSLDLRSDDGHAKVASEQLHVALVSESDEIIYKLTRTGLTVTIHDPLAQDRPPEHSFELYPQEADRLVAANGLAGLGAILFREYVCGWRFFNVAPGLARQSARESAGNELGENGENLSVVLNDIQRTEPALLNEICERVSGSVPGFETVRPIRSDIEGKWTFQVVERRIGGGLNPRSISDGTVRLLTLMVIAAWVSRKATLICIEEPENGVHPHLAESFVSALRTVSAERQFLVTTHSPSFLDYLQPEELLLVDKKEGLTEVRRAADHTDIKVFVKKFTLGDLWLQGELEGIP